MHSDARHSIICNRETRRTAEFKLMKGYAVTTNDGLGELATTQAAKADAG